MQTEKYSKKDYDFVIPGHGRLAKPIDLLKQSKFLRKMRNEVELHLNKNHTIEDILEVVDENKYSDFELFLYKSSMEAVYKEFTER